MKNKKGAMDPRLIGILIVIILGFLIYSGMKQTGSLVNNQIHSTTSTLVSSDDQSATYTFSFVSEPSNPNDDCNPVPSQAINLNVGSTQSSSSLPDFVDGIDTTKEFETTDVQYAGIAGIANICSGNQRGVSVSIKDAKAKCTIRQAAIVSGTQRAEISCIFTGTAVPDENLSAKIYGLSSGTATIKFYKTGVAVPIAPPQQVTTQPVNPVTNQPVSQEQSVAQSRNIIQQMIDWFSNLIKKILGWS